MSEPTSATSPTLISAPSPPPFAALVVDRVANQLRAAPDFTGQVAANFTSVIQAVVWFLSARLASPKPYMREDGKAAQALERDLQEDLFEWLKSGALLQGVPISEPQQVAGGRADIMIVINGQSIVNELKRETEDASRGALQDTYSRQASSYDAVDYPFGIVTVLDVVDPPSATPRLDECVWVHSVDYGEAGKRWLVFIRVPGRRRTPAEQTGSAQ